MKKNKKELRSAAVEAQREMERCLGDEEKFAEAQRKYIVAQAAYRAALDEEEEERLEEEKKKGEMSDEKRNQRFREIVQACKRGQGQSEFKLERSVTSSVIAGGTNNMTSAGVPLSIKELINPLEMQTVYNKVGLPVSTGVRGQIIWPCLNTMAEVTVKGETLALDDTDLNFSKISATEHRMGISIEVSNEAINDAAFDLVGVVTREMNAALARVLNKAAITTAGAGALVGPFAGTHNERVAVTFAGAMPTYAELLSMKGKIANKGVNMVGFCYIMNAVTYAALEATPITAGDSRMIIEGGKIAGYPVFQTDSAKIADGAVNAGCFGYAALNQHGDAFFIVDPYTKAKNNMVVFTLNAEWSLTTLKYEAFAVGTPTGE